MFESRPPPPPLPALTLPPPRESKGSLDSQELQEDKEKERNLFMFKKKHLFVELHELRSSLAAPRVLGALRAISAAERAAWASRWRQGATPSALLT